LSGDLEREDEVERFEGKGGAMLAAAQRRRHHWRHFPRRSAPRLGLPAVDAERVKATAFESRLLQADFDPNLALPAGSSDNYFF